MGVPKWLDDPIDDPREEGFSEEQSREIEAYEEGSRRFFRELANGEWDQEED